MSELTDYLRRIDELDAEVRRLRAILDRIRESGQLVCREDSPWMLISKCVWMEAAAASWAAGG